MRYPKHDLESLMYMILYMMTGYLPWEAIMQEEEIDDFTRSSKINQLKIDFDASDFWQTAKTRMTFLEEEGQELRLIPNDLKELYKSIMELDPK